MKLLLVVCASLLLLTNSAQSQTSGPENCRAGTISGNRVKTVFGNWGIIGQPATDGPRGAWLYPTNGYIGDQSILIGLELPLKDYNGDGKIDTVHSVITCPFYPAMRPAASQDVDPVTGQFWTFEPVGGYCNPNQNSPAIRSNPATWPSLWPDHPEWESGKWDGLRGPDTLIGDEEAYFKLDDQQDKRFNIASNNPRGIVFHPDSLHLERDGAGITVAVRYIQSANPYLQDVLFRIYDVTNQGTTDYSKVVFGTLTGTYIGVTATENYGEYANDAPIYFPSSDFILSSNFPENSVANPLWQGPVGKFGEAFVEAPSGRHIASCDIFAPSSRILLGDDEDLWNRLKPGAYSHPASVVNDTIATRGEDADYVFGSGYFSLNAGETKRVVAALAYGNSKEDIFQKIELARALYHSGFRVARVDDTVRFKGMGVHRFLWGPFTIEWIPVTGVGTVSVYYSPDLGTSWIPVAVRAPNTGSVQWNTLNYPDAAFGLLRIFFYDQDGVPYGFDHSQHFSLKNNAAPTPFVRIVDAPVTWGGLVSQGHLSLPFLVGDSQWGTVGATLSYRTYPNGALLPFETFNVQSAYTEQYHHIALGDLPNSPTFQLQIAVSSGESTWSDSTVVFDKRSSRAPVFADHVQFAGLAQVPVNVFVVNSGPTRGDTYRVTFADTVSDGPKTFSVWDDTRRCWLLADVPFYPNIETISFDGLAFLAADTVTSPDWAGTRWNRALPGVTRTLHFGIADFVDPAKPGAHLTGYRQPFDYKVVFDDTIVDTTVAFDSLGVGPTPVNFRVYNMRTNEKVKVAGVVYPGSATIVLLERVGSRERMSWAADLSFNPPDSSARKGDTLFLVTKKGLSIYDTLTIRGVASSLGNPASLPTQFSLSQNFPNPFNPKTTIWYQLPRTSQVRLVIYDLLGRAVQTLVNELKRPGEYEAVFDAGNVSSGVYFCRLQAGSFVEVKKMLLVK